MYVKDLRWKVQDLLREKLETPSSEFCLIMTKDQFSNVKDCDWYSFWTSSEMTRNMKPNIDTLDRVLYKGLWFCYVEDYADRDWETDLLS